MNDHRACVSEHGFCDRSETQRLEICERYVSSALCVVFIHTTQELKKERIT